jgi:cell wall-associated NlpC family hydrolase
MLFYKTEFGINLKDYDYNEDWHKNNKDYYMKNYYKDGWRLTGANPKLGDAMLFKFCSNIINHVGIYVGNGRFIHCFKPAGVCLSKLENFVKPVGVFNHVWHDCF